MTFVTDWPVSTAAGRGGLFIILLYDCQRREEVQDFFFLPQCRILFNAIILSGYFKTLAFFQEFTSPVDGPDKRKWPFS